MKYALCLFVAALAAFATMPVAAEENNVHQDALSAVGLGGMKVVAEENGMQVRGKFAIAKATSLSYVSGVFYDPGTGSQMNFGSSSFGSDKSIKKAEDKGYGGYGGHHGGGNDVDIAIAAAASLTTSGHDPVEFKTYANGYPSFSGKASWGMLGVGIGASAAIDLSSMSGY